MSVNEHEHTNEELATLAKAGDRAALGVLWEQNRGLLARLLYGLTTNVGNVERMKAAGVTFDDLIQESYFAIERAARLYDPARGARFTTFLPYAIKQSFFTAVGLRTSEGRHDPLTNADRLDAPISTDEPDGATRADTVPDERAADQLRDIDEKLYIEQLHKALDECLNEIPEKEAYAIRARYYEGRTQGQTAAALGCSSSYVGQLERYGLRKLRGPAHRHRLASFHEEIITTHAYHGTGFSSWEYTGSAPERIVEMLERYGLA